MKTNHCFWSRGCFTLAVVTFFLPPVLGSLSVAGEKKFASPEEAVSALATALKNRDTNALIAIFGPDISDLKSPDPVQAGNELSEFTATFNESNRITRVADNRCILQVGNDRWPFAIPIVRTNGSWFFDTQDGKDELLNRRIGFNELDAMDSLRAGAEAQREYASRDRDGDSVLEFAQRIVSTPGQKDGLYWSPEIDGEVSPLGPAFADAQKEGYFKKKMPSASAPQPFHGYFFKILTRQGKHAPGRAYNYIINGNMIGGFAFVAWPAEYGESGIMTFIINQQGKIYQKDFGPNTDSVVGKMKAYDPDPSWTLTTD